ncbi:MAG TPA: hypothetical protein VGO00_12590, partial [Kofleriaceae bacterium]|nr:hypothetical protein [Kofleriaceae bacterium]
QIRVTWWGDVSLDDTSFALAPDSKVGPPVVLDHKTLKVGQQNIALMSSKLPLLARTTYHLMVASTKGGKPSELAEVTTTADLDGTAPTWKGVKASYYIKYEPQCCMCRTGGPEIDVDVGDASDDTTPADQLVYGVWPGDGTFDPKSPMVAMTSAYRGIVALGSLSICSAVNFDLPEDAKSIKLRIAPIDLSGNIGTPSSVTIDLSKPLKQHP